MDDTVISEVVQEVDIGSAIVDVVNSLCQNLFSSIDNAIFPFIDKVLFVREDITESTFLEKIIGSNSNTGLLILANALLLAFVLYYAVRRFASFYSGSDVESAYVFLVRAFLVAVFMNCSLFICSELIVLTSNITDFICFLR